MQLRQTMKLTYLITAYMCYTPNGSFTANDASFYNSSVGYLHDTLQVQLIVYAIIKITRRGTTVPLYEFADKQPKKEYKLGGKKFTVKIKCN